MLPPGPHPPPGWWPAPPPPQPGCVPLRPLDVGDFFSGTVAVLRRNARTMFVPAAGVAVLGAAVSVTWQARYFSVIDRVRIVRPTDAAPGTVRVPFRSFFELIGLLSAFGVGVTVLGLMVLGTLATVVADDVIGYRAAPGEIWQRVRPRLPRLAGLALVVSVVEGIGLVLCIAPGVWLWGIWAVALPTLMIERGRVWQSLRRSQRLVEGTFWRAWGIRALGYLAAGGVGSLITTPVNLLVLGTSGFGAFSAGGATPRLHLSAPALLATGLSAAVAQTVVLPILASFEALLYVDLRMRKENLVPWLVEASRR